MRKNAPSRIAVLISGLVGSNFFLLYASGVSTATAATTTPSVSTWESNKEKATILITSSSSSSSSSTAVPPPPPSSLSSLPSSHSLVKKKEEDSWEQFTHDVYKILNELRSEELDTSLKAPFAKDQSLSFTTLWDSETWDTHTSRTRYLRYILTWPKSRLLGRILPQFVATVGWACLLTLLLTTSSSSSSSSSSAAGATASSLLRGGRFQFELPLTSLTLISGFVATLLTLRSNQGLDRLNEGRRNVEKVLLHCRDTANLVMAYVFPHDPSLALLLARHLALFGWIFQGHLRGRPDGETDIVRTMLKTTTEQEHILQQPQNEQPTPDFRSCPSIRFRRNAPFALLTRLRQVVADCADRGMFRVPQHTALERNIYSLHQVLTACERILTTPIPPIYTSHTSRLLIFYLVFLPIALFSSGLNPETTILTTAAAAFAMLGLDEIGHLLEQPFQLMPLYQSAKVCMMDVADVFLSRPPELPKRSEDDGECKK